VNMLPPWLRWLAYGNPFFYFINGLRHSMIAQRRIGSLRRGLTLTLCAALASPVWRLFSIGYACANRRGSF